MGRRHFVMRGWRSFGILISIAILSAGCLSDSVLLGQASGSGDPAHFSYDAGVSLGVKRLSTKVQNGVTVQDVTYVGWNGDTVPAYLVIPQGTGKFAAVIWAHWVMQGAVNSSREEFLEEAISFAPKGVVSLLIDSPQHRPGFKPTPNPVLVAQQIIDLRRGLDLLLARADVDKSRIAYVGHSWNEGNGAILDAIDKRFAAFVFMSGPQSTMEYVTSSDSPRMVQARKTTDMAKVEETLKGNAWADPGSYANKLGPAPALFQYGLHDEAWVRAVVACGWFGIQSWIGGQAIFAMANVLWPSTVTQPGTLWVCFLGFWGLNMLVVWNGVQSIRFLQSFSAPFMLTMSVWLLAYMLHRAGGFGPMLSAPSKFHSTHNFLTFFFPSLTAMVGYWATLSLNIPDFTRYARNQDAQIFGQTFGLPVAMTLYSFIGIACTSASTVIFGEPIWNPVTLLGRFHQPFVAFMALIGLLVATMNVNLGANVVSPSNDFSNLAPRLISFRTGGLITGFLGLSMMPWKLMSTFGAYVFGWLVGYSGLLGPVAGIMVADYFLIRGTKLDIYSLYHRGGIYEYSRGINLRAIVALCLGVFLALSGILLTHMIPSLAAAPWAQALTRLYDYAWFVGFFFSGGLYHILMLRHGRDSDAEHPE